MRNVTDLLFELATLDRLSILSNIKKKPMNLTEVSKKMSSSVQATSRQLERLKEAKFIDRNPIGYYRLTPFGELALSLLSSFVFLNDERDYLLAHDLSFLPQDFVLRLGQLSTNEHLDDTDLSLGFRGENILRDAKQYIGCISDKMGYGFSHRSFMERQNQEKIEWRYIFPKGSGKDLINDILARGRALAPSANFKIALLDNPKISVCMNEKHAFIAFPDTNGRVDYRSVFVGEDPSFHKWCLDLYNYYWDIAEKRPAN